MIMKLAWLLGGLAMSVTGAAAIGGWPATFIVIGSWIGVTTVADILILALKSSKQ